MKDRKLREERDLARLRLRKARGALYRIVVMIDNDELMDRETDRYRIRRIAKGGCGKPKKRKTVALPGQIDLEEWIDAHIPSDIAPRGP